MEEEQQAPPVLLDDREEAVDPNGAGARLAKSHEGEEV